MRSDRAIKNLSNQITISQKTTDTISQKTTDVFNVFAKTLNEL